MDVKQYRVQAEEDRTKNRQYPIMKLNEIRGNSFDGSSFSFNHKLKTKWVYTLAIGTV
jgi:hypothetical protein